MVYRGSDLSLLSSFVAVQPSVVDISIAGTPRTQSVVANLLVSNDADDRVDVYTGAGALHPSFRDPRFGATPSFAGQKPAGIRVGTVLVVGQVLLLVAPGEGGDGPRGFR
jgi:hypothetical protein